MIVDLLYSSWGLPRGLQGGHSQGCQEVCCPRHALLGACELHRHLVHWAQQNSVVQGESPEKSYDGVAVPFGMYIWVLSTRWSLASFNPMCSLCT
jgi:hypothetical protein